MSNETLYVTRQGNANRPSESRKTGKPPKACVVVLDDDRWFRRAVRRTLRAEGFEVLEAEDVSTLETHLGNHRVDLIVADSRLPDVPDGWASARIAADESGGGIPVIPVSGYDATALKSLGADVGEYVMKGGWGGNVLAAVEKALRDST